MKSSKESDHVSDAPDLEEVNAAKLKGKLKRRVEAHPEASSAQILHHKLQEVVSGVLSHLPERSNLVSHSEQS